MKEERKKPSLEGRLAELLEDENKALLVGAYQGSKGKEESHEFLDELENLGKTYGLMTIEKIYCPLRKIEASTFLGKGKVEEIAELIQSLKADLVIIDNEITPQQQRNLEKILKCLVVDRTELILGVFDKHAKTREARLQVELAKLRYQMPRLKRLWTHLSRQRTGGGGGAGGHLKGEGETQIEIDRRLVRKEIDKLKNELEVVKKNREVQRKSRVRQNIPTFAIVGYTNAGKSSLLNALTGADVLVEDKLFATLDTTTRKFTLPNNQPILLIDTVGFIRKLPHTLVAAFKSTLEEAVKADILIHLIDASSPSAMEHILATFEVLKELKADERPMITVLNKIDLCENRTMVYEIKMANQKSVEISAKYKTGLEDLEERMIAEIALLRKAFFLRIPQSHYALVGEIMEKGNVYSCDYEENDVLLHVEIPKQLEHKIEPYIQEK